jgi:hypothetical protein
MNDWSHDLDRYLTTEPDPGPCEVCGYDIDNNCVCPECDNCGDIGNPECYEKHGMVRTQEQVEGKAKREKLDAEEENDCECDECDPLCDDDWCNSYYDEEDK